MTAAIRPKDLTTNLAYGIDSSGSSPSVGMSRNRTTNDARGQFDGYYPDLSLGRSKSGDASSLEGDVSPRATRSSSGPTLPPLHPQLLTSVHSHPFSQRRRTLSSDTMTSTGSSVVSIDAGKHGFIIHDDASATGSLVLAYEQGREIPPAEYDLPKAILGIDERSIGYSVESEEEFHKLPYHIRSRLNLSQADLKEQSPPVNRRWSNIPNINISDYGAVEEGLMDIHDRVKANNYPSPEGASTAANTMCYSSETSPLYDSRVHNYAQHSHYPLPEQLQMPSTAWVSEEHLPCMENREETNNDQTNVYLSMALVMVLFVGMIYGLFFAMKMMA